MRPAPSRQRAWLAAALAVLTLAVYAPVVGFAYLNYDDLSYVVDEPHVNTGITPANVSWAFTTYANANWHPLTNLSHMLDVQLFGVDAGAHHGVNLAFHVANVLLLFWLLAAATSRPWPSAFVAALFAVHPLNIQTVAWIAERKSLLSTLFWLLALLAHTRHRRTREGKAYLLVIVFTALAVAAKPMAVTLPLTLVLFDIWPLDARPAGRGPLALRYARELAPVLGLAAACGVLTLAAQRAGAAIQTFATIPLAARLANGVVAYVWYLKSMVWPVRLAVFYPHPESTITATQLLPAALVLAAISAITIVRRREAPYLVSGWCWYVGTLLPVAGLIQVGWQAYADRYAYIPLIGIFCAVVWAAAHLTEGRGATVRRAVAGAGVAAIAALALSTRSQLPHWHDTIALFQHAIEVVPDNSLAHNNLGVALVRNNEVARALGHFESAVALAPADGEARANLGNALRALGRPVEAVAAYQQSIGLAPNDPTTHFNLATALLDLGREDEAVASLAQAIRLDPGYVKARLLLATVSYRHGRFDDALRELREVARLEPQNAQVGEWIRKVEAQR